MLINDETTLAEITAAFSQYESALVGNDVDTLDRLFWNSPLTVRFGASENLVGYEAIKFFRMGRAAAHLGRRVTARHIAAFGGQFATTAISFVRDGESRIGRQTQTWIRFADGWRVVAAHVSWMDC
jgi:hypothetical protein